MRYRAFDLRDLPVAEWSGALRSQLAAWQPFPESHWVVQLASGWAQVHAIPRDTVSDLAPSVRCWPESTLHEPLLDQGVRLLAALEGFEGQVWAGGILRVSRWWPRLPSDEEWQAFVRASGLGGGAEVQRPAVETLAWRTPLVSPVALHQLGQGSMRPLQAIASVALLALLALTGYATHDTWDAYQAHVSSAAEAEALRTQVEPVLKARERAAALQQDLAALLAPLTAAQPLEVLDHLSRRLPNGVLLKEFDLQGLEVRLLLEAPADVSRSRLIEALEAGGWFTGVSEQTGSRAGIVLQMTLASPRPPTASNTEAGVSQRSDEAPASAPSLPPGVKP